MEFTRAAVITLGLSQARQSQLPLTKSVGRLTSRFRGNKSESTTRATKGRRAPLWLKQAIAKLTVDWLWNHFGFCDRGKTNPVDSPFRTDNTEGHESFSVDDQGRRFKDHNSQYLHHRGDGYDFFQLLTGKGSKEVFAEFVTLAGLGDQLRKYKDTGSGEHATELELARVLAGTLPPLRCVRESGDVYQNGFWNKKDKSLFKPRALEIQ